MFLVFLWTFTLTFSIGWFVAFYLKKRDRKKHVCIVVLGDIGRSPRMQYHAKSFAQQGFQVDILGYPGSDPLKELVENENVHIIYMAKPPDLKNKLSSTAADVIKVIFQSLVLLKTLIGNRRASFLLLQNPPAIPTIPICWLYCSIARVQLAIDWHNYAYSIMALSKGSFDRRIIKIARFIEMAFGAQASQNFCVTRAMKQDLKEKWHIEATVLYDRPAENFHPINVKEKHELLMKLSKTYEVFKGSREDCSVFTEIQGDEVVMSESRPGLLVSSTSWTEDEDFSVLVDALNEYDAKGLRKIICVITGKGPLQEMYRAIMKNKKWEFVTVVTPWLENEDYPKLLASADLGVSLHTSSSGLDLPMKVVDMFGCGLPVCAYDFNCLNELVKHGENGLVFSNATELAKELETWFDQFPNNEEQNSRRKAFVEKLEDFQNLQWHGNWTNEVLPHFEQQL